MNQNISKFLIIYREKEKTIEEKNKHIQTLQQRFNEIEKDIENIYTHKEKTEYMFDQRLYNVTKQIQEEEKRTIILIVLFILVILANI
jgi:predicted nucleotide-binding protein (sugar kinase/HSP70/actin superfamily)